MRQHSRNDGLAPVCLGHPYPSRADGGRHDPARHLHFRVPSSNRPGSPNIRRSRSRRRGDRAYSDARRKWRCCRFRSIAPDTCSPRVTPVTTTSDSNRKVVALMSGGLLVSHIAMEFVQTNRGHATRLSRSAVFDVRYRLHRKADRASDAGQAPSVRLKRGNAFQPSRFHPRIMASHSTLSMACHNGIP